MKMEDLRVLIIDDSPRFLDSLESMLNEVGVSKITRCPTAQEAIDLLSGEAKILSEVDLIICDQHMDKCTGIDLLKIVRITKSKEALPFFLITSDATRPNIIMLAQNGGNNFIAKPPQLEDLTSKIKETFQMS